uniref:(northern house mosquito) hypothetical protein n=1 Tax=Culex pipiens TaxID=7175 RepID=A0A8D8KVX3_CULPI
MCPDEEHHGVQDGGRVEHVSDEPPAGGPEAQVSVLLRAKGRLHQLEAHPDDHDGQVERHRSAPNPGRPGPLQRHVPIVQLAFPGRAPIRPNRLPALRAGTTPVRATFVRVSQQIGGKLQECQVLPVPGGEDHHQSVPAERFERVA